MEQRRSRGRVETTSIVAAFAEEVWSRATSPEGINHELGPWLKMTVPAGLRDGIPVDLAAPARLGRSWVLAFGFLPVEFDDINVIELEPGRRFKERSRMATMAVWGHERIIETAGAGTRVTDRVSFELRRPLRFLPGARTIVGAMVAAIFRHRHRRLQSFDARGSQTR